MEKVPNYYVASNFTGVFVNIQYTMSNMRGIKKLMCSKQAAAEKKICVHAHERVNVTY